MKRILPMIILMALVFCACGPDPSLVLSDGPNHFAITAESFTGSESRQLVAEESSEITVTISAQVSKGSLSLTCHGSNSLGEVCSYDFLSDASYTITLSGPNTYSFEATGHDYSGYFSIEWEIMGAVATNEEAPEVLVIDPNEYKLP